MEQEPEVLAARLAGMGDGLDAAELRHLLISRRALYDQIVERAAGGWNERTTALLMGMMKAIHDAVAKNASLQQRLDRAEEDDRDTRLTEHRRALATIGDELARIAIMATRPTYELQTLLADDRETYRRFANLGAGKGRPNRTTTIREELQFWAWLYQRRTGKPFSAGGVGKRNPGVRFAIEATSYAAHVEARRKKGTLITRLAAGLAPRRPVQKAG